MRRSLSATIIVAALCVSFAAPAAAGNQGCTKGNVQGFAKAGIPIAKQADSKGKARGTAAAWANCQFRGYDDNGPAVPHVFSTDDWFVGGLFAWIPDEAIEQFGLTRAEAVDSLGQIKDRLYWREVGGNWAELPLTISTVKAANAPLFGQVFHITNHRYHVFAPGTVAAGDYEWKWAQINPFVGDAVVIGTVRIEDA